MNSKQRVKITLENQAADRVPINYIANAGIDRKLKDHFSIRENDDEGLLRALEIDFRNIIPKYIGKKLHNDIPEKGILVDNWGIRRKWIEHESGGYWDYCEFPLEFADEEMVSKWPLPNPDDFDYEKALFRCKELSEFAISTGDAGFADIINSNGMLRGMEQTLVDLITDDPAGLLLAKRRTDINLEIIFRTLEKAKGNIDFLWLGEDLGTQIGPIISLEIYRKHIRPLHQKFIDIAKNFNIPVMIHTCGSSSWVYEDFIEMGVSAVDTLQPEAVNMSPEYLKKTFGGRLAFHGCISTAGPVATGSVDEVIKYCRNTLDIMMPGGGYCFTPTHCLQDNSPVENVLAMYETAKKYGKY